MPRPSHHGPSALARDTADLLRIYRRASDVSVMGGVRAKRRRNELCKHLRAALNLLFEETDTTFPASSSGESE
jgi:hypothetical protein